jgi:hypothetical protein
MNAIVHPRGREYTKRREWHRSGPGAPRNRLENLSLLYGPDDVPDDGEDVAEAS